MSDRLADPEIPRAAGFVGLGVNVAYTIMADGKLSATFRFGDRSVEIREGDILAPGFPVDAVVSSDDNYLTMGSGVSRGLARLAGREYVREAQTQGPVMVTSVIETGPHGLQGSSLDVRHVLHGAVIDYDTWDLSLEQAIGAVTANALRKAEKLEAGSILFPAFATGSGGLSPEACARRMCEAFKAHLAHPGHVEKIFVMLWQPAEGHEKFESCREFNRSFIRQADLVLGVPYDPSAGFRQTHDFFGRQDEIARLRAIVMGGAEAARHVAVVGGPRIGKSALLDRTFYEHRAGVDGCAGRPHVARLSFGRLHSNTPASFVFRRLLLAMKEIETNGPLCSAIDEAYADENLDREGFVAFLRSHAEHYQRLVFLIDDVHRLLELKPRAGEEEIWSSLDRLGPSVQLIVATNDDGFAGVKGKLAGGFAEIRLKCLSRDEAQSWADAVFERYLDRKPEREESEFLEREGGRHPYALGLAVHALINSTKYLLAHGSDDVEAALRRARDLLRAPRRAFFDLLMGGLRKGYERKALETFAEARYREARSEQLVREIGLGKKAAAKELAELEAGGGGSAADDVDPKTLATLEDKGYLIDTSDAAACPAMFSHSFEEFVREAFPRVRPEATTRHEHLEITLLSRPAASAGDSTAAQGQAHSIITVFLSLRSAQIREVTRSITEEHRSRFLSDFKARIDENKGPFEDLEAVGRYLLAQFTGSELGEYLNRASTVLFVVDDDLQDLPWELILETGYVGEIPFRVGRCMVDSRPDTSLRIRRARQGRIRALLIGDPAGDLSASREEVSWLAGKMRADRRFLEPRILLGPDQCTKTAILNELGTGEFALVHYSGHSRFNRERSAWQIGNGDTVYAYELTNAMEANPPSLVFSSSCQSGEGGKAGVVRYDNQAFDLPGAFLGAGVPAYIGTLWKVDSTDASLFAQSFYGSLLNGAGTLAEALRLAKEDRRRHERQSSPAYILYGDPRTPVEELLPALRPQGAQPDGG